jgi:hypothetical protein
MGMFTDLIPQKLTPQEQKWSNEAAAVGLKWLKQTHISHGLYSFNECKHEQEIGNSKVRIKSFKCHACYEQKIKDEAHKKGLTLLSKYDVKYANYKFNNCGHEQRMLIGNVGKKTQGTRCIKCYQEKLMIEATEKNLTWLKKITGDNSLYKCNICRNEYIYDSAKVRCASRRFRCNGCVENKWVKEAKQKNITFIENIDAKYAKYIINGCGHEKIFSKSVVRKFNIFCDECKEIKWQEDAALKNLIWICQIDSQRSQYIFKECGHEQTLQMGHIRTEYKHKCTECQNSNWDFHAKINNLTRIGQIDGNYSRYIFNECGHEQTITMGNVERGIFACQSCEGSWVTRPSNLYVHLIELQGESIVKVGIAKNVERRSNQYGLPDDAIIKTLLVVPFDTGKQASDAETAVLRKFRAYKAKNIGHIMAKSGETECFEALKLPEILAFTKSAAGVK